MNKDDMKYYFQRVKYATWDEFQACMIHPEDDGDTCEDKISQMCHYFPSETLDAWEYFKAVYDDIPDKYKMRCLLNCVYQDYRIDYFETMKMIRDYLHSETPELKAYRIDTNKSLLKNLVDDTEYFKVWRGTAENNILPEHAVSWSLSEETARWFVEHHKIKHHARFGFTLSIMVRIEDVLYYSDDRAEQEVYVIPESIRNNQMPKTENGLESLDEQTFCMYFDWTEEYQECVIMQFGRPL